MYHCFPPFVALGTRTNVVSATLMTGLFLIFSLFPLLMFPLQKSLANLPLLGSPKGWLSILFSKTSRYYSLALPFVIFSKWEDSSLLGWKVPSHLPSWSISLRSLRYWAFFHEVLIPKSSAFFYITERLMGHIHPRSLCSWACSLELSQSQLVSFCISWGSQVFENPQVSWFSFLSEFGVP